MSPEDRTNFLKTFFVTGRAQEARALNLGVETSGVERSSCDARVLVLPKRQNKMADIILDRQAIAKEQITFSHVRFQFCSIFSLANKYLY